MTQVRSLILLSVFVGLALAGTGCRSSSANSRPDVDATAAIEMRGHNSVEVARVISEVFREAAYLPVAQPAGKSTTLIFEKEGSKTDTVLYGDWSGKVWYRAKIKIETPDPDVRLVKCDVYRVVGHGDARFEEEKKISLHKGTYQKMLEQAWAKLEAPKR